MGRWARRGLKSSLLWHSPYSFHKVCCPKASLINLRLWWQQERNWVKALRAAANSTEHWHWQLASGFHDSPVKDHPRALLMWMNQRTPVSSCSSWPFTSMSVVEGRCSMCYSAAWKHLKKQHFIIKTYKCILKLIKSSWFMSQIKPLISFNANQHCLCFSTLVSEHSAM